MSVNKGSKHYDSYYDHVLNKKKLIGSIAKVYDLIADISDRRGLKHEWNQIDGDIQDEVIDAWLKIIDNPIENPHAAVEGIITAPYILTTSSETDTVYEDFMKKYDKDHELCPQCGSSRHSSTLVGYLFDISKPEQYKDKNICVCQMCAHRHTMHDRISVEQFFENQKNKS